jgi:tetratricopeptide (TPR) repeat protein
MSSVTSVAWQEYQSEHFILDTDVSEEDAATIMATFEGLRAADLLLLAGAGSDFAGRIRLFIPAELELYKQLTTKEYAAAYYTHSLYFSEPIIVAPASLCLRLPQAVAHELAHAVSYYIYPQQRGWFSEGLAQFVETVGRKLVRKSRQSVEVKGTAGELLDKFSRFLKGQAGFMRSTRLLAATALDRDSKPELFYGSAWLLYHWLWNARGPELAAFQRRLAEGEDWDDAWRASFPLLDPGDSEQMATLDGMLIVYRKERHFLTAEVSVNESFAMIRRPFPAMRFWVAVLRADWPTTRENRDRRQREELERARVDDPHNPDILLWLAGLEKTIDAETARAVAQGAPDRYRGWLSLAGVTGDAVEKEKAYRQAAALGPDCAVCNNNLAWFLSQSGRSQEALGYANRAVDLAPWSTSYLDTLADVASRLGQCKQAIQLQTRAMHMAESSRAGKGEYAARLESMQERCKASLHPG